MELQLKHLCPYLPYELKFEYNLKRLTDNFPDENRVKLLTVHSMTICLLFGKPILRPLSDLIKEIEIKGKIFIPLVYLAAMSSYTLNLKDTFQFERLYKAIINDITVTKGIGLNRVEKLLEWNFDIYSLISQGLAIDYNTINKKTELEVNL